MREKILTFIEKNSRIDLKELAIVLGVDEAAVINELQKMEEEHVICGYHTLIDWDKTSADKVTALIEVRVTPQIINVRFRSQHQDQLYSEKIQRPRNCYGRTGKR